MPKEIKFYKKKKFIALAVILILGILTAYLMLNKKNTQSYDFVTVKKSDIRQEVSVTGHVKASEDVDLAFEVGGKADKVDVEIGDKVQKGQELVALSSKDIKAQLLQAQAGYNSEVARVKVYEAGVKTQQATLDNLKKGYSKEEILLAETGVVNAQKTIADSENQLNDTKSQAEADLQRVYSDALNYLPVSANAGKTTLMDLTDIQYSHFQGYEPNDNTLASAKEDSMYKLFGILNAGRWNTKAISTLNIGLYGKIQEAVTAVDMDKSEELIRELKTALQSIKTTLNSIPVTDTLTATEKTTLDTRKAGMNTEISALSTKLQAVKVQKAASQSAISAAESALTAAKNSLATAQKQLAIKRAGYTDEEIRAQEAQVDQAKASLASQKASIGQAAASVEFYKAQLDKTVLRSPIDGVVTAKEVKSGEMVSAQKTIISVIDNMDYEMEADIPEVDIAKVNVGNFANVTLDAYGNDIKFDSEVTKVDPAETIIDGVATYKTTLKFKSPDERIKSGMTANIDILTAEKEGVLSVPQRAIITKDGKKIARILISGTNGKPDELKETQVETGLKGSDGTIEIIKGLNEGDKVVVYIKETK